MSKKKPKDELCIRCLTFHNKERKAQAYIEMYGQIMPVCNKCKKEIQEEDLNLNT